jgi:hypothetical protein
MKLIDCTVYANKPKGGIPGTLPGVWVDRPWRTHPEDALSWSTERLRLWAESQPKGLPVLFDVEPIFNASERLNHESPEPAEIQVSQMLRVIRDVRPDLRLWIYTGGWFWPRVRKDHWGQHPQMRLRKVLVRGLYEDGLCEGSAEEAYPIYAVHRTGPLRGTYNEAETLELMFTFFANLQSSMERWTRKTPLMPVLGTLFITGGSKHPMPASTFRGCAKLCAARFEQAMVWGGPVIRPDGTQARLREFAEHADFFGEEARQLGVTGHEAAKQG